jgi:hypothetical protein
MFRCSNSLVLLTDLISLMLTNKQLPLDRNDLTGQNLIFNFFARAV